jgi:hypothetical protein
MYPFDNVALVVALIGCFLGLRSDLSCGKIPNRLTCAMLILSAAIAVMRIISGDSGFLALYLQNFVLGFLTGIVFWYIRAWSGGDAKMFWALCSLLPAYSQVLTGLPTLPLPWYSAQFFGATILFNLLILLVLKFFLAAVYLFFRQGRMRELLRIISSPFMYLLSSMLLGAGISRLTGIPILSYLSIPLILILSMVEKTKYLYFLALWLVFMAAGAFLSNVFDLQSCITLLATQKTLFAFAFLLSAYAVGSRIPFTRKISIKDLRKGMSLSEEIRMENGQILREEVNTSLWNTFVTWLTDRTKHDYVARPRPIGLTEYDLGNIRKYENELGGFVEINTSFILMPFILTALILSLFGDFLWMMLV